MKNEILLAASAIGLALFARKSMSKNNSPANPVLVYPNQSNVPAPLGPVVIVNGDTYRLIRHAGPKNAYGAWDVELWAKDGEPATQQTYTPALRSTLENPAFQPVGGLPPVPTNGNVMSEWR